MSKSNTITLVIVEDSPDSCRIYMKGLGTMSFRSGRRLLALSNNAYKKRAREFKDKNIIHSTISVESSTILDGLFAFDNVTIGYSGRKPRVMLTIKECNNIPELTGCSFVSTIEVLNRALNNNQPYYEGKLYLNTFITGGALELIGGNNG